MDYSYFHGQLLTGPSTSSTISRTRAGRAHPGAAGPGRAPGPCPHQHRGHSLYPVGETHFLKPGDTACVLLYPASRYSESDICEAIRTRQFGPDMSVLLQAVKTR